MRAVSSWKVLLPAALLVLFLVGSDLRVIGERCHVRSSAPHASTTGTETATPVSDETEASPLSIVSESQLPDEGTTCPAPSGATSDSSLDEGLRTLLAGLASAADVWMPGLTVSIAVQASGGSLIGTDNQSELFVSASSVKPVWLAAALTAYPPSELAELAESVVLWSDNVAAGEIIGLVGVDVINDFAVQSGLVDTKLVYWSYAGDFFSRDYAETLDGDNYTTAADLVRFYSALTDGALLGVGATTALVEWLRLSPVDWSDQPWTSPLANDLPQHVRDGLIHKAGWLPADCCGNSSNIVIDAGTVFLDDVNHYSVAIMTSGNSDFDQQVELASWISCSVYIYLSGESWQCSQRPSLGREP